MSDFFKYFLNGKQAVLDDIAEFKFSEDGSTGFYAETINGPLCFAEEGRKIGKWIFVPEPTAPNRAVRRAEAEFTARVWKLNAERNTA